MSAHAYISARLGRTEKHKSGVSVLRKIRIGARLIYRSTEQPASTGQTPPLVTNRGKHDAVSGSRIPDELVRGGSKASLTFRCFQSDQIGSVFGIGSHDYLSVASRIIKPAVLAVRGFAWFAAPEVARGNGLAVAFMSQ